MKKYLYLAVAVLLTLTGACTSYVHLKHAPAAAELSVKEKTELLAMRLKAPCRLKVICPDEITGKHSEMLGESITEYPLKNIITDCFNSALKCAFVQASPHESAYTLRVEVFQSVLDSDSDEAKYDATIITDFRNPEGKKLFRDRIHIFQNLPMDTELEKVGPDGKKLPPKVPKAVYAALKQAAVKSILQIRQDPVVKSNLSSFEKRAQLASANVSFRKLDDYSPKTPSSSKIGERFAVVIGVSSYKDPEIPKLKYASKDAKAFYKWLISKNGGAYKKKNVMLLVDQDATSENMKKALFRWLKQAIAEDMVVIYFAGHGSPESPDAPENLYLLPYDTNYNSIVTSAFPMWDIETALNRFIKAGKVVVIADACHSGGVGHLYSIARRAGRGFKVNPINSKLKSLSKISDGICVISAASDTQTSQESNKWGKGHGVFTYYMLEALNGKADYNKNGQVSLGELLPYVSEKVRRATQNAQTPQVSGKFDPQLTIGK